MKERDEVELVPLRWWHLPMVLDLERTLFGGDAWSAEMFWSELAGDHQYYLAAFVGSRLVGYAGLAGGRDESYVQTIAVAPDAAGRGIGSALLQALLDEARRRGAARCWLEVRVDNDRASRLYRRFGFVDRHVRRGYYQPSGADALVMELPLRQPVGGRR